MDFFEGLPQGDDLPEDEFVDEPQPVWHGPPEDVLGGVLPLDDVMLRDDAFFIALRAVTAYSSGLSMSLQLAVRRGDLTRGEWQERQGAFWAERYEHSGVPAGAGALRLGVELADGRRVATLDRYGLRPGTDPEPPVLLRRDDSGSSGPRRMDRRLDLWLWPFPEGETLTLALQWADLGIPVITAAIDLAAARQAAQRETRFWE